MAVGDDIGAVLDERGDALEAFLWGLVFLFTLVLFVIEFGNGVIEPEEEGLLPVATIIDFKQTMFLSALVGGGLFVALTVWAVFRYSSGVRDRAARMSPGQGRLTLTVFVLAVLVIMSTTIFVGASTLAQTDEASPAHAADQVGAGQQLHMTITAGQWFWRFDVEGIPRTQGERVVLPADTLIVFETTSADVIHSFAIKELGITKDAIPAQMNEAWFYVGEVHGETSVSAGGQSFAADRYEVRCAELCGKGHSKMIGAIYVVGQEDYHSWAEAVGGEAALESTGVGGGHDEEGEEGGMEGMDMDGGNSGGGDEHTESGGGH
jgi:cytochrome c oxidase subunit 2